MCAGVCDSDTHVSESDFRPLRYVCVMSTVVGWNAMEYCLDTLGLLLFKDL